ncbi:MAG: class IV adenylate cyclase [Bryobacteraceae bacterium]
MAAGKSDNREVEIKLALRNTNEGRRRLRGAGFRVWKRRIFEANVLVDSADGRLRNSGCLLRVREAGKQGVLTFKGQAVPGKHKDREELEVKVTDPARLAQILARLGFQEVFRYEKYRTEYKKKGDSGVATLDETPIGSYLELEGAPAWIDRMARKMGFRESDYITASYYALYVDYCREHSQEPANLTFK